MSVSKKMKQLMKILLVVFMSFTVIVPDGLVKAENEYLSLDKEIYKVSDPIMVTFDYEAGNNNWIGLYKKGTSPGNGEAIYWNYIKSLSSPFNIVDSAHAAHAD